MNKSFFKTLCSSLICSIILSISLFACRFETDPAKVTNPCIRLQLHTIDKFIVFCDSPKFINDSLGRIIPIPCDDIGLYCILDDLRIRDDVEDSEGPNFVYYGWSLETYPNFYRIHFYHSGVGNTCDRPGYRPRYPTVQEEAPTLSGFAPMTPILMADGSSLQIGLVKEGDEVLSYDFDSAQWSSALVIKVAQSSPARAVVQIEHDVLPVIAGPEQPFYLLQEQAWVYAKELTSTNRVTKRVVGFQDAFALMQLDPKVLYVDDQAQAQPLVCLTLDKYHNFCVGSGIVAHNCTYTYKKGVAVPLFCSKSTIKQVALPGYDGEGYHRKMCFSSERNYDGHASGLNIRLPNGLYRQSQSVVSYSKPKSEDVYDPNPEVLYDRYKETMFVQYSPEQNSVEPSQPVCQQSQIFAPQKDGDPFKVSVPLSVDQWHKMAKAKEAGPTRVKCSSQVKYSSSSGNFGMGKKQLERTKKVWDGYLDQFKYQFARDAQLREAEWQQQLAKSEQEHLQLIEKARELAPERAKEIGELCLKNQRFVIDLEYKKQVKELGTVDKSMVALDQEQAGFVIETILAKPQRK